METRKINEVPILEQATAETHVLVEQNGTASRIPVSVLGGADEKNLIEKLTPAFKKTGSVVTCKPVEGHPLEVVSHLTAINLLAGCEQDFDNYNNPTYVLELPAGKYKLNVVSAGDWFVRDGEGNEIASVTSNGSPCTFTHNGGVLLIEDYDMLSYEDIALTAENPVFDAVALTHNGETINAELPQRTTGGTFNWTTGVLSVPVGNPNLIAVDLTGGKNWSENQLDNAMNYVLGDLPNGTYTLYCKEVSGDLVVDGYSIEVSEWIELARLQGGGSVTFDHPGGTLRLNDENWMVTEGGITQTPVKLEAGSEYTGLGFDTTQLTPHEIIGFAGVNTLSSNTGDTEVSGRADPTAVIQDLNSGIDQLTVRVNQLSASVDELLGGG